MCGREIVPLLVIEDDQMANSPFNIIYSPRLLGTVRTNRPGAGQSERTSHLCHTAVQDLDIGLLIDRTSHLCHTAVQDMDIGLLIDRTSHLCHTAVQDLDIGLLIVSWARIANHPT